jgi:predicted nucleic acid-binding protein
LFDTNIILDVLLERDPHFNASAEAWVLIEDGLTKGMLSAHAVTTLHYLIGKEGGNAKARKIISELLSVFEVAAVDRKVIDDALKLNFSDFEDAVTAAAAQSSGCNCIVTRDPKGFRASPVRCLTPEAAIPLLRKDRLQSQRIS